MSVRHLFGLEPDKISGDTLRISGGSCFDYYGQSEMSFPNGGTIELNRIGLWGADKPLMNGSGLYIYALQNKIGEFGLIASQEKFSGDVVCPEGFSVVRKLPWGVVYDTRWGGIPNFHLAGWPRPDVRLTDSEYSGLWSPLASGASGAWEAVDCSAWIPDNARMGLFVFESRYADGGTAGSSYVRSHGGQATGVLIGSVSPGSPFQFVSIPLRVDSLRKFQYRVTGTGCRLSVRVLGYSMTEPA